MKVRCVNIFNQITKQYQKESRSLTIGQEYTVLELKINFEKGILYRLIYNDNYTPALFDSKQFEVVSNVLPSNWIIYQSNPPTGAIKLTPKPWSRIGFWEDYFELSSEAIAIYEKEKNQILLEEQDSDQA